MQDLIDYLNQASETGSFVTFLKAKSLLFNIVSVEKLFVITLEQAGRCLQTPRVEAYKETLQKLIFKVENSAPQYQLKSSEFNITDYLNTTQISENSLFDLIKGINSLMEATTRTDRDWQRALLSEAYQKFILYQITDFWLIYTNGEIKNVWDDQPIVEFLISFTQQSPLPVSISSGCCL
ncbi:MAG: hypothetical protein AAFY41_11465, partial [Bacteroidota bacterium]